MLTAKSLNYFGTMIRLWYRWTWMTGLAR